MIELDVYPWFSDRLQPDSRCQQYLKIEPILYIFIVVTYTWNLALPVGNGH